MTIKASAGPVLILAAGLFVVFAGPSPATAAGRDSAAAAKSDSATSGKSVRHGSQSLKKRDADRKNGRVASKPAETKAAEKEVADANGSPPPAIPESVANAKAQMTSADAAPDSAKDSAKAMSEAMSAKANTVLQATADKSADGQAPADSAVIASDQLNDVDRVLQETPSTQTVVAMAAVKPAPEAPALASNDSSTLDQTSLIGKIFIAFGALLTMASAARMFMA
jgi:hypothetical protein